VFFHGTWPVSVCNADKPHKVIKIFEKRLASCEIVVSLHPLIAKGALAQMVEQWTENPCVPSSILGGTTLEVIPVVYRDDFFYWTGLTRLDRIDKVGQD